MKRIFVTSILMISLVLLFTACAQTKTYNASLTAVTGVATDGTGTVTLTLSADGNTMDYKIDVNNLNDVTMAHIHIADTAGGNGAPAVWLYPAAPPPKTIPGPFSGTLISGTVSASNFIGGLAGKQMSDLLAAINEGRAYVNVHTTKNPDGEIRGILQMPSAPAGY